MNGAQMADMMFVAITGRAPFGIPDRPRWKVSYADRDTGEEKEVTVVAATVGKATDFVDEEYGEVLGIEPATISEEVSK